MFITALTSARYLSLFWTRTFQSIRLHLTFWRSILILSSNLYLSIPSSHSLCYFHQNPVRTSPVSHTCQIPRPSNSSWANLTYFITGFIWWRCQLMKFYSNHHRRVEGWALVEWFWQGKLQLVRWPAPLSVTNHIWVVLGSNPRLSFFHRLHNTMHSESRYALRLRYVDLVVSAEVSVEVCCCFTVFSC
jgi:hypothetical protein